MAADNDESAMNPAKEIKNLLQFSSDLDVNYRRVGTIKALLLIRS
jgi:hypothetical protein